MNSLLVYDELREQIFAPRSEPENGATLHVPVLVEELYGELQAGDHDNPKNREHFSGLALIALRHLLVDIAWKLTAACDGPRPVDRITFGGVEDQGLHLVHPDSVMDLNFMLDDLEVARPDLKTVAEAVPESGNLVTAVFRKLFHLT